MPRKVRGKVWKDQSLCACINLNYVKNISSFLDGTQIKLLDIIC